MTALTFEEAYNATDPNATEDQRKQSANLLVLGSRANQQYWDSRNELEALRAQAEGHGEVVRGSDEEPAPAVSTAADVEGTAVEEPAESPALAPGDHGDLAALTDDELQAELDRRKAASNA